ncbi:holo-ACP synthase [Spiroplasma endosymbiont of Crioceris asparagi]|uniref:holo-ACP synthase n=1 Tax=Spiroplasma endosymbiont of Crioceris asparagi TaxID=3066286 RepID=UPI0030D0968C
MNKVGIDIVQINRIKLNEEFLKKILHKDELLLLDKKPTLESKKQFVAGRWACKEAIFKAVGKIEFSNINITYNEQGQPIILGHDEILISISHETDYAVAVAFAKK